VARETIAARIKIETISRTSISTSSKVHRSANSSVLTQIIDYPYLRPASRLSRDSQNMFPGYCENYTKKLFFYIFGGFCSVL
jgi:hypothetical protein